MHVCHCYACIYYCIDIQRNMNLVEKIPVETLHSISSEIAKEFNIIPYYSAKGIIHCYGIKGIDYSDVQKTVSVLSGQDIFISLINEDDFHRIYYKNYRNVSAEIIPGVDFLNKLIGDAYSMYCSDIHFECYESRFRIRFRIDGKLIEQYALREEQYAAMVNQIKIMAKLDIAQKRLPQDGRITYSNASDNSDFDVRVSILPSVYGEKVVMRLLTRHPELLDLQNLGMNCGQYKDFTEALKKQNGIIIVSGPTGSGKSTTLYAALHVLNTEWNNILTIEDPVEYTIDGVNQVQLKEDIGLTFPIALRTFLRQDPDVIMVGEIRDDETAKMAIRSSMTGHPVLTTLHAGSAWGCIRRLEEMGIHRFLIADTALLLVGQRLIRLLCPYCKQKYEHDGIVLYRPIGCPKCFFSGYRGRKAIYEIIPVDWNLKNIIRSGDIDNEPFCDDKITSLKTSALRLVEGGLTSLEEIITSGV